MESHNLVASTLVTFSTFQLCPFKLLRINAATLASLVPVGYFPSLGERWKRAEAVSCPGFASLLLAFAFGSWNLSFGSYLQHFGAKIYNLDAICRILKLESLVCSLVAAFCSYNLYFFRVTYFQMCAAALGQDLKFAWQVQHVKLKNVG